MSNANRHVDGNPRIEAPTAKYPMPFGPLSEYSYSLPDRLVRSVRQGKNGNGPTTNTLLGNVLVTFHNNPGALEIGIWESGYDTPDGYEVSTGFSLPRSISLPKDNFGKRSKEYAEARDIENGWKQSVVSAFLDFREKALKTNGSAATGGSIVRLVKRDSKQTAA